MNTVDRQSAATGGRQEGPDEALPRVGNLCAFWLGRRCYALDVSLVGEMVAVEQTVPVPQAHAAVRGVFNLRGAPVPLLDLSEVLGLPEHCDPQTSIALVLRSGELVAAVAIDRMEAVVPAGRGAFAVPEPGSEHPAVLGFLDDRQAGRGVLTVLAPVVLLERLMALRYTREHRE